MKTFFQNILLKTPKLYRLLRSIYRLPSYRFRIVKLSRNSLSDSSIERLSKNPHYNDVIDDLVAYTGFTNEELPPYLLRYPEKHFESEFNWYAPKNEQELTWYYRGSSAYLFANAAHPYASTLDIISQGKVLDYGAGIGCNSIGLAKRGLDVDFLEICRLQADFINFRCDRHKLNNLNEIRPYHDGTFNPILCITEKYDAIVAMDVLEHIPNYHILVRHFIEHLHPGGMIIENSPFEPSADDIAIHVRPSMPIDEAMSGMNRIGAGIWKKQSA
jgi:2-polyprenyl-3-methyl-5-hydroxy-6-metoxy-1,4-benzoquinol methylase